MIRGLELSKLCIMQGEKKLAEIDLEVPPREVITIMGPSGSGKSTALAAIIGALPRGFTMMGQVFLDGQDITHCPPHQRGIGLLFQEHVLFPHLSVGGNLSFAIPPEVKGRMRRMEMVEEVLESVNMAGFSSRDPATLSGGQKARVALMRALLARPKAILLDEPFSQLDAALRGQVREFVYARIRKEGLAALLVTHDKEDAEAARGRVFSPLGYEVHIENGDQS